MLLVASTADERTRWISHIRNWQSRHLAVLQQYDYTESDSEATTTSIVPEGSGFSEYFTEQGVPYYLDHATNTTMWAKPTPKLPTPRQHIPGFSLAHPVSHSGQSRI
jgi:hypothetical protein